MKTEQWKPVVGYEGIYEISSLGRVKRVKIGPQTFPGRILKLQIDKYGYHRITLCKNRKEQFRTVHSLVCEAFICPRKNGMQTNHKNGIKTDNRLENLEWVTNKENAVHAVRHGLWPIGEKSRNSKFMNGDILEIRKMLKDGHTQWDIAHKFGVYQGTISYIKRRKRWGQV